MHVGNGMEWNGMEWNGWMDGWMDGWMYVRTYVRTYVCMYVCMYVWVSVYNLCTSYKRRNVDTVNVYCKCSVMSKSMHY